MQTCIYFTTALTLVSAASQLSLAADVRFFEKDGVTYREMRRVIRRPVTFTELEERERTVYRRQITTEDRNTYHTYRTPVAEYSWVTRVRGRWNPFVQPYLSNELVPVTWWETRSEVVRRPVTRWQWVPEKRIVRVPVTTRRMEEEEIISRVAVNRGSGRGSGALGSVARRESLGRVVRPDSDPPRKSTGWRPAGEPMRR